jgi:hypothetical protein
MSNSESTTNASDSLDLIDLVFAATITVGLTPELLGQDNITGMLSEPWVKSALAEDPFSFTSAEILHALTFLVGLITLLLSWFGVHASLRAKPILPGTVCGMLRFVLDVALVISYGVVLIFFRQLNVVLMLLAMIYIAFVVWDTLKTIEHWKINSSNGRKETGQKGQRCRERVCSAISRFSRQLVSLVFAILFLVVWLCWNDAWSWSAVVLALLFTLLYRVAKLYPKTGVGIAFIACIVGYVLAKALHI